MNRETKTKINEKAVMMAINPLMLGVDIAPRGLDTPGVADGVGIAIVVKGRLAIGRVHKLRVTTQLSSRLRGRSNEAH
jgi:hypothetical protein